MSPNPTDEEVLEALDWDTPVIKCKGYGCRWAAEVLLLAAPTTDSCEHVWTPCCKGHEAALRNGQVECPGCNETYIIVASREL